MNPTKLIKLVILSAVCVTLSQDVFAAARDEKAIAAAHAKVETSQASPARPETAVHAAPASTVPLRRSASVRDIQLFFAKQFGIHFARFEETQKMREVRLFFANLTSRRTGTRASRSHSVAARPSHGMIRSVAPIPMDHESLQYLQRMRQENMQKRKEYKRILVEPVADAKRAKPTQALACTLAEPKTSLSTRFSKLNNPSGTTEEKEDQASLELAHQIKERPVYMTFDNQAVHTKSMSGSKLFTADRTPVVLAKRVMSLTELDEKLAELARDMDELSNLMTAARLRHEKAASATTTPAPSLPAPRLPVSGSAQESKAPAKKE